MQMDTLNILAEFLLNLFHLLQMIFLAKVRHKFKSSPQERLEKSSNPLLFINSGDTRARNLNRNRNRKSSNK